MLRTFRYLFMPSLRVLGFLLVVLSLAMLLPLGIAYFRNEASFISFCISFAVTIFFGLFLIYSMRSARKELEARDAFLLVSLAWLLISLFAAFPLILALPKYSFSQIYFEAMSCITTTGATAFEQIDLLDTAINYWRCFLSWLGGLGIIILAVAILPFLGVGGAQIFLAENSYLFKESKLTPRIADTAKALYSIYVVCSVACVLAYHWAGMSWDESIQFMFTTISLGGTAPYDNSLGHFNSPAIELIAIIFMFIAGFNFMLHFVALKRHSILLYLKDPEALGWMTALFITVLFTFAFLLFNHVYPTNELCFRHALFSTVSLLSTTGFATIDYSLWPNSLGFFLLFIALIATCSGSTGGGIKMARFLIMMKKASVSLERLVRPRAYVPMRFGEEEISNSLVDNIFTFITLHFCLTSIATGILLILGLDFLTAFSSIIASLGNIGPALGNLGPISNYAHCHPLHLWVCTFCMFVGRLELIAVFALFSKSFWRI